MHFIFCNGKILTFKDAIKRFGLVQSGHHHHFIECTVFSPWYSWKIAHLAL